MVQAAGDKRVDEGFPSCFRLLVCLAPFALPCRESNISYTKLFFHGVVASKASCYMMLHLRLSYGHRYTSMRTPGFVRVHSCVHVKVHVYKQTHGFTITHQDTRMPMTCKRTGMHYMHHCSHLVDMWKRAMPTIICANWTAPKAAKTSNVAGSDQE